MKKIILQWMILLVLSPVNTYAHKQVQDTIPQVFRTAISGTTGSGVNIIPPTPQSQIFQKYINHEVNGYNGLPDINIPLYEIDLKGFKIPIHLSYHASGIKYKQTDGDVGPGWSFTAGGFRVIRDIYGRPDEAYPMYNPTTLQQKKQNQHLSPRNRMEYDGYLGRIDLPISQAAQYPFIHSTTGSYMDGEYDMFTYLLPSGNGEFIISDRNQKQIASASIDQSKIVLDEGKSSLTLENIKITDNQGYIYYFGGKQADGQELAEYTNTNSGGKIRTAWLLRKIVTPFNEEINFTYRFQLIVQEAWPGGVCTVEDAGSRLTYNINDIQTVNYATFTENYIINYSCGFLSEITTPYEIVTMTRKNSTGGVNSNFTTPLIESILVKEKLSNQTIKHFRMDYLVRPPQTEAYFPRYNLLSSVRIGNGTTFSSEKKYTFNYYDIPSGRSNTLYPDQWGYLRLHGSSILGSSVLNQEFGEHEYMYSNNDFRPHKKIKTLSFYGASGTYVNRQATAEGPIWYSLKEINFPNGGSTTYEYESNRYKNGNTVIYGGGLRIKKITSNTGNETSPIVTEFTYGRNEDGIGTTMSADYFGYNHLWGFADEYYYYYSAPNHNESTILPHLDRVALIRNFHSKPCVKGMDAFMQVQYPEYTQRSYDTNTRTYNGKIVNSYTLNATYGTQTLYAPNREASVWSTEYNYGNKFIGTIKSGYKPLLSSRKFYNGNNILIKHEGFEYRWINTATFTGVRVKHKHQMAPYTTWDYENITSRFHPYKYFDSFFSLGNSSQSLYNPLMTKHTILEYDEKGEQVIEKRIEYSYDPLNRLSKITQNNSQSGNRIITYTYPAAGTALYTKNKIVTPIQTVTENNGKEIERVKYTYASTKITPDYMETSTSGVANLEREVTYEAYDDRGNIRQYTGRDGIPVTYIWGYDKKYPVAEIVGADLAKVRTVIPESSLTALANRTVPTTAEWTELNQLITSPQMAGTSVTLYKYKPLVGITEMTSPGGQVTLYTYDNFGRLTQVSLKTGNTTQIVQTYSYNYINK